MTGIDEKWDAPTQKIAFWVYSVSCFVAGLLHLSARCHGSSYEVLTFLCQPASAFPIMLLRKWKQLREQLLRSEPCFLHGVGVMLLPRDRCSRIVVVRPSSFSRTSHFSLSAVSVPSGTTRRPLAAVSAAIGFLPPFVVACTDDSGD